MAERREDLRAADVDRQFVADRLKSALDEGRLSLGEYDERLRDTYAAKTYGDLDQVIADLPGPTPTNQQQLAPIPPVYPTAVTREADNSIRAVARSMPQWLLAVWGAWLIAVSVNLVIWLVVSISDGELAYFWPMWVAGPWGAVLLATTVIGIIAGEPERHIEKQAKRDARRAERDIRRDYRPDH